MNRDLVGTMNRDEVALLERRIQRKKKAFPVSNSREKLGVIRFYQLVYYDIHGVQVIIPPKSLINKMSI